MRHLLLIIVALSLISVKSNAQSLIEQKKEYTRADSLRGSLRPERSCYDVTYYELKLKIDTLNKTITGSNKIAYRVLRNFRTMQIDLYENMGIINITLGGKELRYRREFNAVFVEMEETQEEGTEGEIVVNYSGKPTIAKRPPWDGGFTWTNDKNGKTWIGVSCEGMGASLWWPNKDYLGDEPDSMRVICTVPSALKCVVNGREDGEKDNGDGTTTYKWYISYPINNYNISLNIGDYVHWKDIYTAADGAKLDLDYYVLSYNLDKAKKQFAQVQPMMRCYEKYLGKYPFWNDGYALVETPYLGMEHQGAIAYGNQYKTGYAGIDFSRIGLDFDYIIIHETGHEWWGNSVSCADIADMWIHEGFCTYTESIYVECMYGYETALRYINAKKPTVTNKSPMVGVYGVNEEGDGDMYNKGMLFLNTLRYVFNDDTKWWGTIKCMSDTVFKMQNIGYQEVMEYFSLKAGKNLAPVFEQYLKHSKIPVLEYRLKKLKGKQYQLSTRWVTDVSNFAMPVFISTASAPSYSPIGVTNSWQNTTITLQKESDFKINQDWAYIDVKKL
ncbi:MAG: M1 family metallopeptidase [Chitinophagales bacterium]